MSAGTEMALPEKGSALRAAHASSQAAALRDVMKTFEQPAWMRLSIVSLECETGTYLDEHTQMQREGPGHAIRL